LVEYIVASLCIGSKIFFEKIGKKKPFDNDEHYKKLNGYEKPQLFPDTHISKTIIVKMENP
jgi:hypothetical protein